MDMKEMICINIIPSLKSGAALYVIKAIKTKTTDRIPVVYNIFSKFDVYTFKTSLNFFILLTAFLF